MKIPDFSKLDILFQVKNLILTIDDSQLGKLGCQKLFKGLEKYILLQSLTIIIKNGNQLKSEVFQLLRNILLKINKNLQKLTLKIGFTNEPKQEGAIALGEGIANFINLKYLELDINCHYSIDQKGFEDMFLGLSCLQNLEEFKFRIGEFSRLQEGGAECLGKLLGLLQKLKKLEIVVGDFNEIRAKGVYGIFRAIGQMEKQLQELKVQILDFNQGGDDGAIFIGEILQKMTYLKKLHIVYKDYKLQNSGSAALYNGINRLKETNTCECTYDIAYR